MPNIPPPSVSGWVINYHWTRVLADARARILIVQHYHRPLGTLGAPALLAQLAFDRAYRTRASEASQSAAHAALDQACAKREHSRSDALNALEVITVTVRQRPSARTLQSLDARGAVLIIATRGVIRAVFIPLSIWSAFWRATATSCVPSPLARHVLDLLNFWAVRAEPKAKIARSQDEPINGVSTIAGYIQT